MPKVTTIALIVFLPLSVFADDNGPPTQEVLDYLKGLGHGSYLFGQVATWVHNENPDMDHATNWLKKVHDHTGTMPRYGTVTYDFDDDPFPDEEVNRGVKKIWDRGMIVGVFTFFANPSGRSWNAPIDIDLIFAQGENSTAKKKMGKVIWWSELGIRGASDRPRDCLDVVKKLKETYPELAGFVF